MSDHEKYDSTNQPRRNAPDENLDSLISNWELYRGHMALFLGAGASVGAINACSEKLPTAIQLRDELWSKFMLTSQERNDFDYSKLGLLTLDHATAIAETKVGRRPIAEWLEEKFTTNDFSRSHKALAYLNPSSIFTTNFDRIIENNWLSDVHKKPLCPVYNPRMKHGSAIPLYKPHGDALLATSPVGEGGVVISQFDYFKMQNDYGTMLDAFFSSLNLKCVIFIGYSFQDMDIASRLYKIRESTCDRQWYAVFPRNDPNVRSMYERHYRIKQIARTFEQFIDDLDRAVNFLPPELKK